MSADTRAPGQRPANALAVYRRIIHDARICHGAFRLWHYLHDRRNKAGQCWPEQRTIARDIHCKTHSLPGWTSQLVAAGYLSVCEAGQNHHHVYQMHFGDGRDVLPEWATRGAAKPVSCRPKGQAVSPPEATPRDAATGDGSNHSEVITKSKGGQPPKISTAEIIKTEKSLERLDDELKSLKDADLPKAVERKKFLKAERVKLLTKLDVPV
jgi:hypothetical protein